MNINLEKIKSKLTFEQSTAYVEFRSKVDPNNKHSEGVLLRYLGLCKFDVEAAISVKSKLEEHYNALSTKVSDEVVLNEIKTDKFKFATDNEGRKIVHYYYKLHDPSAQPIESSLKLFIMLMDILIDDWDAVEKGFIMVCWMEGSGWNNFDFQGQQRYVEQFKAFLPFSANMLGKCILVDSPWYVRIAMGMMKPFLPSNMMDRYVLCNSDQIEDYLSEEALTPTDIFRERAEKGLYSRYI